MLLTRFIARMDIKGPNLVKGIQLEGLRKIGDPNTFARKYYQQGIDEIIYMDIVASLYGRNNSLDIVRKTTRDVFIPITVGGGLRNLDDVRAALRSGADKVAINTALFSNPDLTRQVAETYGSQCMVASIEAKKSTDGRWEAYYDNGRGKTGVDAVDWAVRLYNLGAGEILLTSVDQEGTQKGFDYNLIKAVTNAVNIPVIVSGGMGTAEHLFQAVNHGADAVAAAAVLHYNLLTIGSIKEKASACGLAVRM
ncbi:MAG: imidazole glycerol phosphate synthase subunit HisF [Methylocystaceae bacterium]